MKFRLLASFVAAALTCAFAKAQDTNIAEFVNAALAAKGPVPVTVPVQVRRTRTIYPPHSGREVGPQPYEVTAIVTEYETRQQLLTATSIYVVSHKDLVFAQPIKTALPTQLSVVDQTAQNNSATIPESVTLQLQIQFQRSSSISLQHTISHVETDSVNFNAKLSDAFSVGGSLAFGSTTMDATTRIDSTQQTVTRTNSIQTTLPPHTALMAEIQIYPIKYSVPFTATVIVDANLSPNGANLHHLSDFLPEAQRTFNINGTIDATDSSEGKLVQFDLPYQAPLTLPVSASVGGTAPSGGPTITHPKHHSTEGETLHQSALPATID